VKLLRRARFEKRRAEKRLRRWHRRARGDPGVAVSLDMGHDSRTLLLTFGGMKSLAGLASFEFVNLTAELPVKRMFVRDPRQSWYHRGMPRHGTTLASVVDAVGELLADHELERLVLAGNSAGGYAALVFGTLLGADAVVCLSPQTVIDTEILAQMGDHRWDYLLEPLVRKGALEPRWTDLRRALPQARHANTRYNIYFDETIEGDRLHAERLRGLQGVHLYRFGRGGHGLARALRDCGALERILRKALGLPLGEVVEREPTASAPRAPQRAPLRFRSYR
jgi:pimeloyl-ACP methyl ester carboxylesterase